MKKNCIIFLLSIIISVTIAAWKTPTNHFEESSRYLRIHIRADSNDFADQSVKYAVRDSVVEYLTPLVSEYETKDEALKGIEKNLSKVVKKAEETLRKNGFSYGAKASLKREEFPTRVYGEYTLPQGEYSALIIELGSGQGDNWWCVVYPPLCFSGVETGVVYKSKIKEIIKDFFD